MLQVLTLDKIYIIVKCRWRLCYAYRGMLWYIFLPMSVLQSLCVMAIKGVQKKKKKKLHERLSALKHRPRIFIMKLKHLSSNYLFFSVAKSLCTLRIHNRTRF